MNEIGVLLIVAISARALVEAAKRAGYRAVAVDAFGDQDLLESSLAWIAAPNAMAGFAQVDVASLLPYAYPYDVSGVVYGTGFDDCPSQLARLSAFAQLLGASPEAVGRAKEPVRFAALCAYMGLRHPDIRYSPPPAPDDWLLKRKGGCGGLHVREGWRPAAPGDYWQRRVAGRAVSLLFTRGADVLTPVAWSEQWSTPCESAPFRYGGAAGPIICPYEGAILARLTELTGELGLRGLASADFIDDGENLWFLEINPRPGATLDVFDDEEDPLLLHHLDAVMGQPARDPKARKARAAAILYAEKDFSASRVLWPDWVADRPTPGVWIPQGAPICTVIAKAATVAEARQELSERILRMREYANGAAS